MRTFLSHLVQWVIIWPFTRIVWLAGGLVAGTMIALAILAVILLGALFVLLGGAAVLATVLAAVIGFSLVPLILSPKETREILSNLKEKETTS